MWQILSVKYKFPEFYIEKITAASYTADSTPAPNEWAMGLQNVPWTQYVLPVNP